ncbi:Spy/CpxP family protein refolding chaperone [Pleurocapsa sp. FMAR1]|uniref:Spy/CpxP family protein refolding chaperone n=1 Tax=Pleurocapsa sp. FMAR1 TaxID=3040204 RepID=UPI0029C8FABF|nr:Spy/CpxP family protein refolding chaperone [Pleurocapsa sp. FMAR1]
MNQKTFSAITAALLILPLGTYAATLNQDNNAQESMTTMGKIAQNHDQRGKRGDRGERMNKLLEQLDLSTEQKQRIEAIQNQSKTDKEALREQMQSQRQSMRSLLASDASTEQLRQQHQKTEKLHQQADNNRFETMLRTREILTSEQRAKMATLMEQHKGKRSAR